MKLSPVELKELFSFYSFLEQMHYNVESNNFKHLYCCKNIEKRKKEFINYLKDINYITSQEKKISNIDNASEEDIKHYITYLIKQPETCKKYEILCDCLDRLKVIYTPILKKYYKYFIPNDPYYCYNSDEEENDYICPFVIDKKEYCIYLDMKNFRHMDDLKLCFVNVEEKPEEIKNYELLIDKFIKTKNSELFEYIPFGLLVLIEYNLKNTKYTKKELERLFFKYVDNANDIYKIVMLLYFSLKYTL